VKNTRGAIQSGESEAARSALTIAERVIRKAASKGVLPRARANRTISRLARAIHQLPGS
jgi:ribosomal protein S20